MKYHTVTSCNTCFYLVWQKPENSVDGMYFRCTNPFGYIHHKAKTVDVLFSDCPLPDPPALDPPGTDKFQAWLEKHGRG